MKSFLKHIKILYAVEGNQVTAFFSNSIYPLAVELIKHSTYKNFYMTPGVTDQYILDMKGIAVCKDGDVFDEKFGKKLARQRLLRKFYRYMKNLMINHLKDAEHKVEMYNVMVKYFTEKSEYHTEKARSIATGEIK